jgi:hypothetical protein
MPLKNHVKKEYRVPHGIEWARHVLRDSTKEHICLDARAPSVLYLPSHKSGATLGA